MSTPEGMAAEEGCAGDVLQWFGIKKTGHRLLQSQGVGIGEMLRGSAENVGEGKAEEGFQEHSCHCLRFLRSVHWCEPLADVVVCHRLGFI